MQPPPRLFDTLASDALRVYGLFARRGCLGATRDEIKRHLGIHYHCPLVAIDALLKEGLICKTRERRKGYIVYVDCNDRELAGQITGESRARA